MTVAKGGYESSGEPLSAEELFPEVVWYYEHCGARGGREELRLVLDHWREITEIVATAPDSRLAMQALMERYQLGQPAVHFIFGLKIGDLTAEGREMILSVSPPPRSEDTDTAQGR